jgi:hypothetical protein
MKKAAWQSRTKDDLVIEVWEQLDCESVGATELTEIQNVLRYHLGEGAVDSPAAIARALADEGAELRHPEVLECDAVWREAEIEKRVVRDPGELFDDEDKWNLEKAAAWIGKLERLRKKLERQADRKAIEQLEDRAREQKRLAQLLATNSSLHQEQRLAAAEIGEWLTIWLQTPQLFKTWLELRRKSSEFLEKFGQ